MRTPRVLALAAFVVLAATFDGFSVAAVYHVGFEGVLQHLLGTVSVIVGTASAYMLAAPLIRTTRQGRPGNVAAVATPKFAPQGRRLRSGDAYLIPSRSIR
jgi:hypothetical protein